MQDAPVEAGNYNMDMPDALDTDLLVEGYEEFLQEAEVCLYSTWREL